MKPIIEGARNAVKSSEKLKRDHEVSLAVVSAQTQVYTQAIEVAKKRQKTANCLLSK